MKKRLYMKYKKYFWGLAVMFCVSVMSILPVQGEETIKTWKDANTGLIYALDTVKMEASVYSYKGEATTVTVPAVITDDASNVYKVVGIGSTKKIEAFNGTFYGFNSCKELEQVIYEAPENIRFLGLNAFANCFALSGEAPIPSGVEWFEGWVFNQCSSITGAVLPETLTELGKYDFQGCTALQTVTLPSGLKTLERGTFNCCEKLNNVTLPNTLEEIGSSAFGNCTSLTGPIDIPAGVKKIGNNVFQRCSSLTGNIKLPDGLTSLGAYAFYECPKLEGEVVIPSGVTQINECTFYNCKGLTSIVLHDGIQNIEYLAFKGCEGLTGDFKLPSQLKTIEFGVLSGCSGITSVNIPETVTVIDMEAFYNCKKLEGTIKLPETMTEVPEGIFYGCESLTNVILPEGITAIKDEAFGRCRKFTGEFVIPEGVTEIGDYAFFYCDDITNFVLPKSLTSIGENAFYCCSKITELLLPMQLQTIGSNAFLACQGLKGKTVYIPQSVTSVGKAAFGAQWCEANSEQYYAPIRVVYPEDKYLDEYSHSLIDMSYKVGTDDTVSLTLKRHVIWFENEAEGYEYENDIYIPEKIFGKTVVSMTNNATYPEWFAEKDYAETRDKLKIHCQKHNYSKMDVLVKQHTFTCKICSDVICEEHTYENETSACSVCGHIPFTVESAISQKGARIGYKKGADCTVKVEKKFAEDVLRYQWCENGMLIPGAMTSSYTIPAGKNAGSYTYTCIVSNGAYKAVTKGITFTVYQPEIIGGNELVDLSLETPQTGDYIKDTDGKSIYKLTSAANGVYEVEYVGPVDKSMTAITIPDLVSVGGVNYDVTSIADSAFEKCTKLKTLRIGNKVKRIGNRAFYGCTNLVKVTGGKALLTIGKSAFQGCKKLKNVSLSSKKLKSIGAKTFYGCKKLTKITLKTTKLTKKSIGKNALKKTNKKLVIKVPKNKVSAYKKYFKGKGNNKAVVKK